MDSPQLLFGVTAINLMLVASTWTGSRASPRDDPKVVRVKLGTSAAGSTGLLLMDQSVEPTLSLVAGESGTSITLLGADGKRRVIAP